MRAFQKCVSMTVKTIIVRWIEGQPLEYESMTPEDCFKWGKFSASHLKEVEPPCQDSPIFEKLEQRILALEEVLV